ncbi:MAG: hypothetical protein H0T75_21385 [Rhizobiales bacterium]|nr:hypothetical protein [Hyphomicrobiales bacterium]
MIRRRSAGRADTFRDVLRFTFAHWRRQGRLASWVAGAILVATATDVLLPVFAGRLVDAVALRGADREAALDQALIALGVLIGLGLVSP